MCLVCRKKASAIVSMLKAAKQAVKASQEGQSRTTMAHRHGKPTIIHPAMFAICCNAAAKAAPAPTPHVLVRKDTKKEKHKDTTESNGSDTTAGAAAAASSSASAPGDTRKTHTLT